MKKGFIRTLQAIGLLGAAALFAVVDAAEPPLRFFLGSQNLPWVRAAYAERLATWEQWAPVSDAAQGTASKPH